jgi:hypothetical protein
MMMLMNDSAFVVSSLINILISDLAEGAARYSMRGQTQMAPSWCVILCFRLVRSSPIGVCVAINLTTYVKKLPKSAPVEHGPVAMRSLAVQQSEGD